MPTHAFTLGGLTATLNQLRGHWGKISRLKARDREWVRLAALDAGVPIAQGKRRVRLTAVLSKGQRRVDPDSLWKSLLDACVCAGLLVNDSPVWCELLPVAYERGPRAGMRVELEDVEDA